MPETTKEYRRYQLGRAVRSALRPWHCASVRTGEAASSGAHDRMRRLRSGPARKPIATRARS